MNRRDFLLSACAAATAGCVSVGGEAGPPAPAPVYRVGDRWVYRGKDGFRQPITWEEVREVTRVGAQGIEIRVTQRGPRVDTARTERWAAPGVLAVGAVFDAETRVFRTPLEYYRFPLTGGAVWRESAANFNQSIGADDPLQFWARAGGWESVATPAGTYDAIGVRMLLQLNLNDPFRFPTQCDYLMQWSPAVGGTVRETKSATYRERGEGRSAIEIRSQNSVLELVSHARGAG